MELCFCILCCHGPVRLCLMHGEFPSLLAINSLRSPVEASAVACKERSGIQKGGTPAVVLVSRIQTRWKLRV